MFRRLHYFEPGNYATTFRLDPFVFDPAKPIHPELRGNAYACWLHATAARVGNRCTQAGAGQLRAERAGGSASLPI